MIFAPPAWCTPWSSCPRSSAPRPAPACCAWKQTKSTLIPEKGFLTWGWDGTRLIQVQLVGRASGEFQIWNSFMTLLTSNSFFLYSQIWMNNFSFFYLILPLQHFETKKLHKLSPSFEAFPSHPDNPIACKHCVLPGRIVMFYCAKKIGVCTYHS